MHTVYYFKLLVSLRTANTSEKFARELAPAIFGGVWIPLGAVAGLELHDGCPVSVKKRAIFAIQTLERHIDNLTAITDSSPR
jgi:hypothetical protein